MATSPIFCDYCGAQAFSNESFCSSCGYALSTSSTPTPAQPAPTGTLPARTVLKQRYRVLQTVGQGGMGAVYLAEDTQLGDRSVAVKEMSQSNLYGQQALDSTEQFKNEAHLLAGLQHPNLPSIHDYFEENGRWYLVMSFIQGESLADYLEHAPNKQLPLEEALSIGQDLCDVLHYLHTHQPPIIFRDLKPSNIMRSSDGHLYLIDFGIARHFKPGQAKDTASYGSAGYAPPEQYGRAQTTARSDIYSLGATLYEMLSGYSPLASPFRFPPLQSLAPALPDRLVRLITQMLEMDESKRPANIKAVQQELQQISAASPQTPYATLPPPPVSHGPATPLPATQYAPPPYSPAPHYPQAQQIFLSPNNVTRPARPSRMKRLFSIIGKILSIIGMVIGILLILLGFGVLLSGGEEFFDNLWVGEIVGFFGLMTFFIARVRKRRTPVSKARKAKAIVGKFMAIFIMLSGIAIGIAGIITDSPYNSNISNGVFSGVVIIIEGIVIWLVTRIGIKKTP